jgi:hypothetical protein
MKSKMENNNNHEAIFEKMNLSFSHAGLLFLPILRLILASCFSLCSHFSFFICNCIFRFGFLYSLANANGSSHILDSAFFYLFLSFSIIALIDSTSCCKLYTLPCINGISLSFFIFSSIKA